MFASKAEPKSRQKMLTDFSNEISISSIMNRIIPLSIRVGITESLTDDFCRIAIQNLWVTEPKSDSLRILITHQMMLKLLP